jgi:uncharacterized membrane protein
LIVKRVVSVFKAGGVAGVLRAAARRIHTPHVRSFPQCREMVSDGTHIAVHARKPLAGDAARPFDEDALREALRKSPFQSDRQSA